MIGPNVTAPLPSRIVAVDPGSSESGVVLYDPFTGGEVVGAAVLPNEQVLRCLRIRSLPMDDHGLPAEIAGLHVLAIEFPVAMGMPASNELFLTVEWIGRFVEAWSGEYVHVSRPDVKLRLCGNRAAKDPNVRAALIDRFGGPSKFKGTKSAPGPLYGVKSHCWPALAVAITAAETPTPPPVGSSS